MFKVKEFLRTELAHRQAKVKVDELKDWFDGEPVWTVRGLSHKEIAIADEHSEKTKNLTSLISALAGNDEDKQKLISQLVGHDKETPKDTAKRMEHLVMGSIEPKIELDVALKLSIHQPYVFALLTNKILELTGLGSEASVKQKPSGKTQASKTV